MDDTTNLLPSTQWPSLSIQDLYDQRNILVNRITYLLDCGKTDWIPIIQEGIDQIDGIIKRTGEDS